MAPSSRKSSAPSSEKGLSPGVSAAAANTTPMDDVAPRRSSRVRKRPGHMADDRELDDITVAVSTPSPIKKIKILPRRNPEYTAPTPKHHLNIPSPDLIQEAAFAPLESKDVEQWHGWADVESEPAFFNFILQEIGIKDAKIQEIFSVDETSFDFLPRPVYGLIFLYKFREESSPDREDCPPEVWFANQTTANACATVAMLNIAMNCEDLSLGDKLTKFKAATQGLHPALRGHLLSINDDIRNAHNSFARRIDILSSDLALKNEFDERNKKKKAPAKKRSQKTKKADEDAAFHYIAYVPIGDKVWELDGLHQQPLSIGSYKDGAWLDEARSRIEARMLTYEKADENGAFNLLAVCHSPLRGLRAELAVNIRKLLMLDQNQAARGSEWVTLTGKHRTWLDDSDEEALRRYKLEKDDLYSVSLPPAFVAKVSRPSFEASDAMDLLQELEGEQKRICSEFGAELVGSDDDAARVSGRMKDYTAAVHCWVKKLAEKGILKELNAATAGH